MKMAEPAKKPGPLMKTKVGKFDVTVWRFKKKVVPPEHLRDYSCELLSEQHRACIRYGRWRPQAQVFEGVTMWCEVDELRDLRQALDRLE